MIIRINANDILSHFINRDIENENIDCVITGASTLNNPKNNTVLFSKKYSEDHLSTIEKLTNCFIFLHSDYKGRTKSQKNIYVFGDNPRLDFADALTHIVRTCEKLNSAGFKITNYSIIGETAIIGTNTVVEPFCYIDNNVVIGDNCYIMAGSKIRKNVVIGDNCILRENCVIGGWGFGFEKDADNVLHRLPHIGGVIIEDNVEIGEFTAVCSGTIDPTIIHSGVKIDNLVHIAHNCEIGENTVIIACAEVSGSTKIGANCWIAPNSTIINKINIGNDVTIGMGAIVLKDVPENSVLVGHKAETIENAKKFDIIKNRLISKEE